MQVVTVEDISKSFPRERGRSPLVKLLRDGLQRKGSFLALDQVNLEVAPGEKLGLIGSNGAGKTTLLKTIAGLHRPTTGRVFTHGRVTLLSGLGLGMIDELTVTDNVILYGAIYGLERRRVETLLPEILEWAELEDFANTRLKNLSKGMRTRIAFATTRYIEADVYLLDEALSAGDHSFQGKCRQVFESYANSERTFIFSTHKLEFVERYCTRAVWLHHGRVRAEGAPSDVVAAYQSFVENPSGEASQKTEATCST